MCGAALVIFGSGLPVQELLALSAEHASATEATADPFHHTIVRRALERLRDASDAGALEAALASARAGRLEVAWR